MLKFINDHGGQKKVIERWHSTKKDDRVKAWILKEVLKRSNAFEKFFKNLKDFIFKLVEKGQSRSLTLTE